MTVFITAKPSLPASIHRSAFEAISVWLGESFVIIGLLVFLRHISTTLKDISGSFPKATPPSLTLGQEMLISIASISVSSKCLATSPYSSTLEPEILIINLVSSLSKVGKISVMTELVPGF